MRALMMMVLLGSLTAVAAEPDGWFVRNQVAVRANPFGLFDEARFGYRFDGLELATNASVSPNFARAGASVNVPLASFVTVSAIYEGGGSFGNLGLEQSFESPAAASVRTADPSLLLVTGASGAYAAPRHQLILGAAFSATAGQWIFKSNNRFVFQHMGIRPGDHVFYDANWDILFRNDGWMYVNDVDVLFQLRRGLRIGVRYNITHSFLGADGRGGTAQRIGPLVSYLFDDDQSALKGRTLSLVVNWWVQPPLGSRAPPAVPMVGLAFTFKSVL